MLTTVGSARASLSITPETIVFPATAVGDYSYEMATITNDGPNDETILGFQPQGQPLFPTQAGTCNLQSWSVPAGTSCTAQFGFHPDSPGRARQTITVIFTSGATLDVQLTGVGRPH